MVKKVLYLITAILLTWQLNLTAQPIQGSIQLEPLILEALQNNPYLQAAQNTWQAALRKIPQAGALPDPVFSFSLGNIPIDNFVFNQEPMTGKKFSLMQMFPFPGKLGLMEDIAVEGAGASEAKYQEVQNQLVKNVKLIYFDLFFVDKAIETIQKNSSLLEEFVRIAETRYSVGKGIQQDVLRAQVELTKMSDKLITMQQRREGLEAQLNALLNRPPDATVGKPAEVAFKSFLYNLEQLKAMADKNRSILKVWEAMVRQSDLKVKLAKKDILPNFTVGLAYTQRDVLSTGMGGTDYLSGTISLNIPIYFSRKQNKKVEETQYSQISIKDGYTNVKNQIYSGIEKVLSDVYRDGRLVDLFETGIIPQASQSLHSALSGYQTDKVDFLTLLNNEITLFNYELDYYRVLSSYNKGIAQLETLTSTNLIDKTEE
ncbi:MAG TPA: TolC family protein [Bacteroidetes bacterium]|nr:TolC family protein [Bacteroidota bacterium]